MGYGHEVERTPNELCGDVCVTGHILTPSFSLIYVLTSANATADPGYT
jgi:hypothetical protein